MTLLSIASLQGRTRGFEASPRLILSGVTLAIGLIALATQLSLGMLGDVSWLFTIDEKWLSGQVPYVDFVKSIPTPPCCSIGRRVAFARALGLPRRTLGVGLRLRLDRREPGAERADSEARGADVGRRPTPSS